MMSAAVAGTTFRPASSYTTLRDVTGLGLLGYQLMQSKRAVNHERTDARRRPSPRRPP